VDPVVVPRVILSLRTWLFALLLLVHSPSAAAVEIAFYSKDFGKSFPHAFITLEGTVDATGERVDRSYGFSAKRVTPAVLLGSVTGEVIDHPAPYIKESHRHFSLRLSDEDYGRVLAVVEKWRRLKQPSFNLNRRNCVFFVADVAAALGLRAETPASLMKKPRSYVEWLVAQNRPQLAQRHAVLTP
jgi:hypothetical protein